MDWIKRNLFFVVGGVVSLALLGGAGYYIWSEYSRNSAANDKLGEIYNTLQNLAKQQPGPGKTNAEAAKVQEQQLRQWIGSATAYFQVVPGIPPGTNVSSRDFGLALGRTVDQMQHAADAAGIALAQPKYGFSFSRQLSAMTFAAGSLDQLAQQLGEVKAITDIFFATRINTFESIQRVRVSDDDLQGSAADYLDEHPITNELAIITPYVVSFRCFTPELSHVLKGIAAASNTFIVKSVNVLPAGAQQGGGMTPMGGGIEGALPGVPMAPPREGGPAYNPYNNPYQPAAAAAPPAALPASGKGGPQVVLKEQLLRVVMQLEFVKLLPKS